MSSVESVEPGQRTTGLRSMLSMAPVYRLTQWALGATRVRQTLADEYIHASVDDRVLDLGCGTADILDHIPSTDYLGYDPSDRYVMDATRRFSHRGVFTASREDLATVSDRTVVLAIGVLHHMTNDEASELVSVAFDSLVPGGRFVTIDPTFVADQSRIARGLIVRDRGQQVRTPDATRDLVESAFDAVVVSVRHDLLRLPYSHVITQSTK